MDYRRRGKGGRKGRFVLYVLQARVDHQLAVNKCLGAEQQAVAHVLAASQGELHFPYSIAQCQRSADHITGLCMAVGALDGFHGHQRSFATAVAQLHHRAQVRGKTDPRLAVTLERLHLGGVQAGGAGPGVDLGAQPGQPEVGQGHPLAQADHSQMVKCLHEAHPGDKVVNCKHGVDFLHPQDTVVQFDERLNSR